MIMVDTNIIPVAVPAIMDGLQVSVNAALWVNSIYLLTYVIPILAAGRLGDRFGLRLLYQLGLVVFTVSSLVCAIAPSIVVMLLARAVQGIGAALIMPQTMTVITRIFPRHRRGTALGLWGMIASVATLIGPVLGGVLIDFAGWRWIFLINVPIGILSILWAVSAFPKLVSEPSRFDVVGILLSALALFCVAYSIQESGQHGWGTIAGVVSVPLLLVIGMVALVAFIAWQSRMKLDALMPLELFRDRNYVLSTAATLAIAFATTAMSYPLMLYAQEALGLAAADAAIMLIPLPILSVLLSWPAGMLSDRMSPRLLISLAMACRLVSLLWLSMLLVSGQQIWKIEIAISMMGVASAFTWAPLSTTVVRDIRLSLAGAGSGVYNTARQLGSLFGSVGVAAVIQLALLRFVGEQSLESDRHGGLSAGVHDDYGIAMGISLLLPAALVLAGLGCALFIRDNHKLERSRHVR